MVSSGMKTPGIQVFSILSFPPVCFSLLVSLLPASVVGLHPVVCTGEVAIFRALCSGRFGCEINFDRSLEALLRVASAFHEVPRASNKFK